MFRIILPVIFMLACAVMLAQIAPPATPKKPVTDVYHGTTVTDDYRWLEDPTDTAVKEWVAGQNAASRAALDALPGRDAIGAQLRVVFQPPKARYYPIDQRGKVIFAMKSDQQHQHQVLVALTSLDDLSSERVLLDPDALDPKHLTEIDFTVPSVDGRYFAVSLSQGGSENGDVHVYETATGKALPDVIPRVNYATAGGGAAWNADSTGFYYTRYPRDGERPEADMHFYQQVYFHKLGDKPEDDQYSIGKDFSRIAEISFQSSRDARYIAVTVGIGDGGDHEYRMLAVGQPWRPLAAISNNVKQIAFGYHNEIYLLSHENARRGKVLRMDVSETLANALPFVPESAVVIESIAPTAKGLFVNELAGGPSQVQFFPTGGRTVEVRLPAVSSAECFSLDGSDLVCQSGSYLETGGLYHFDPHTRKLTPTALVTPAPVKLDDYEVVRRFAISKDRTKIPINFVHRKGITLDGSHPAILTGYGGYAVSITPRYLGPYVPLLERGFVIAEANLRGGAEYGEDWHEQGKLTKKQNVFDDFAACAHYLIDHKYTTAARLGIIGGSNGGLLMGAALTQNPDLYRAVVSRVGIYDMLRVELSPNGAFNVTEFGTVKEADQFKALYAYSPYHHVKDGTQYPAILLTTGDNDGRVDPMQSRKMAARLQASGTRRPVLLRTSSAAGHGIGSSVDENVAQWTDIDAFLIAELGANEPQTPEKPHEKPETQP